eukprot:2284648-Prymnesium_polylepis.1
MRVQGLMTRLTAQAAQWGASSCWPEEMTSTFSTSLLRMSPSSWYRFSGDLCTSAFATCGRVRKQTLHRVRSHRPGAGRASLLCARGVARHLRILGSLDEQKIADGHGLDAFGVADDVLRAGAVGVSYVVVAAVVQLRNVDVGVPCVLGAHGARVGNNRAANKVILVPASAHPLPEDLKLDLERISRWAQRSPDAHQGGSILADL